MSLPFIVWFLEEKMFYLDNEGKWNVHSMASYSSILSQLPLERGCRLSGPENTREARRPSLILSHKRCTSPRGRILMLLQLIPTCRASERKQVCFEVQAIPPPRPLALEWTFQAPVQPPWQEAWWFSPTTVTLPRVHQDGPEAHSQLRWSQWSWTV